jgi:hypothetical protein
MAEEGGYGLMMLLRARQGLRTKKRKRKVQKANPLRAAKDAPPNVRG